LDNFRVDLDINIVWESIWENIKFSAKECLKYYELKKNKPRFLMDDKN
jgi:hypothetical protein